MSVFKKEVDQMKTYNASTGNEEVSSEIRQERLKNLFNDFMEKRIANLSNIENLREEAIKLILAKASENLDEVSMSDLMRILTSTSEISTNSMLAMTNPQVLAKGKIESSHPVINLQVNSKTENDNRSLSIGGNSPTALNNSETSDMETALSFIKASKLIPR